MNDTPERPQNRPGFEPAPPTEVGPSPAQPAQPAPPTQMAPPPGQLPPAGPPQAPSPYAQQQYQPAPYQPVASPYGAPYGGSPYQQPKSTGGRTALIVIGAIVLVVLLFCGGAIGFVAWVANNVEDSIPDADRVGGPNDPISVEAGEEFAIDDFEFDADWSLGPDPDYGSLGYYNISDLRAENTGDTAEDLSITFTFVQDTDEIGEIRCSTDGNVQPGRSETLGCSSSVDETILSYDAIEVGSSW